MIDRSKHTKGGMIPLVYDRGFAEGFDFDAYGKGNSANPYIADRLAAKLWRQGWNDGRAHANSLGLYNSPIPPEADTN